MHESTTKPLCNKHLIYLFQRICRKLGRRIDWSIILGCTFETLLLTLFPLSDIALTYENGLVFTNVSTLVLKVLEKSNYLRNSAFQNRTWRKHGNKTTAEPTAIFLARVTLDTVATGAAGLKGSESETKNKMKINLWKFGQKIK